MIAVEVLIALLVVTVIVVGIAKIGAPIADAFAERLKLKFKELEPGEERELKTRISSLEQEVRTLKLEIADIRASADFSINIKETQKEPRTK